MSVNLLRILELGGHESLFFVLFPVLQPFRPLIMKSEARQDCLRKSSPTVTAACSQVGEKKSQGTFYIMFRMDMHMTYLLAVYVFKGNC